MRKKIFLLVSFVLAFTVAGLFVTRQESNEKIVVISSSPKYEISAASDGIANYLDKIGFWGERGVRANGTRLAPNQVVFELTDVEMTGDLLYKMNDNPKTLLRSWDFEAVDNKLFIKIYVNVDKLISQDVNPDGFFEEAMLRASYILVQERTDFADRAFLQLVRETLGESERMVEIRERSVISRFLFTLFKLFGVNKVNAQACTAGGSVNCGVFIGGSSVCIGGAKDGIPCAINSDCPGGVCDPGGSGTCQSTGFFSCTTINSCVEIEDFCGANMCMINGTWPCRAEAAEEEVCSGGGTPTCKCENNCVASLQTGDSCAMTTCGAGVSGVMCCPSGGGGAPAACQPIPSKREDCSADSKWYSGGACVGAREADAGKCSPGYACRQQGKLVGGDDLIVCSCQWDTACNPCTATAPSTVTLVSPANGSNTNSASVTLDWTGVSSWGDDCNPNANVKQYKVYTGATAAAGDLVATVGSTVTSYDFTGTAGQLYYWKVQATNGSLTKTSPVWSFYTSSTIQGNVYLDTDNTCSTATPYTLGGASVSERVTGQSGTVGGSGTYSITNIPQANNAYTIDLNYDTANYICSTGPTGTGCGLGCPTQTLVTASSTGNNFFLTAKRSAWWQAVGAPVYAGSQAGGVTVLSQLPSASDRLILPGLGGTSGALLRGSGSASLGSGSVSDDLWSTVARYRGKTMNYNYFAAQMGVVRGQDSEFVSDTLAKPSYDPDRDFWYSDPVSGVATVDDTWVVPSGESYVIFVNGDLRIPENITVAEGGFLAFIVSGDIIVEASVTSIEGIYLSSGNFETETVYAAGVTDDVQLQVEGNVVAWGSLSLTRDLGIGNASTPGEVFTYRPDLLINMPSKMRSFALQWEEVVAGTFGN